MLARPRSLTVAGAAQALIFRFQPSTCSRLGAEILTCFPIIPAGETGQAPETELQSALAFMRAPESNGVDFSAEPAHARYYILMLNNIQKTALRIDLSRFLEL